MYLVQLIEQDVNVTTKKMVLIALFVFLSSLNDYAKLQDNFKGMKFGAPPAKRLKLADRDGPVDIYLDPHETMAINSVKSTAVNSYFFKNKFFMVLVQGAVKIL